MLQPSRPTSSRGDRIVSIIHGNVDSRQIDAFHDMLPGASPGAPHYTVSVWEPNHGTKPAQFITTLKFQNGPIKEAGLNGLTNEDLLLIVADRLRSFQESKFSCMENARALDSTIEALAHLNSRTQRRNTQGIEGTHQPDPILAAN